MDNNNISTSIFTKEQWDELSIELSKLKLLVSLEQTEKQ